MDLITEHKFSKLVLWYLKSQVFFLTYTKELIGDQWLALGRLVGKH